MTTPKMKLVVLLFPSVEKLLRYQLAVKPKVYEMNLTRNTLLCSCTEEEIELGSYVYGAGCLEIQPSLN